MTKSDINRDELRGQGGELITREYPRMPRRMKGSISEWIQGDRSAKNPQRLPLFSPSVHDAGLVAFKTGKDGKLVRFRDYSGRFVSTAKAGKMLGASGRQTHLHRESRYRLHGGTHTRNILSGEG
jgi:hypothetical protein